MTSPVIGPDATRCARSGVLDVSWRTSGRSESGLTGDLHDVAVILTFEYHDNGELEPEQIDGTFEVEIAYVEPAPGPNGKVVRPWACSFGDSDRCSKPRSSTQKPSSTSRPTPMRSTTQEQT